MGSVTVTENDQIVETHNMTFLYILQCQIKSLNLS